MMKLLRKLKKSVSYRVYIIKKEIMIALVNVCMGK
jgi:hypothetical protein